MVEAVKADYAAAKKRGIGARRLNAEFGHSDDSSWGHELVRGNATINWLQLPTWIAVTGGEHVLRYLAKVAGFRLVPVGAVSTPQKTLTAVVRECAELMQVHSEAQEDGVWTEEEYQAYENEVDRMHTLLDESRLAAEQAVQTKPKQNTRALSLMDAEKAEGEG